MALNSAETETSARQICAVQTWSGETKQVGHKTEGWSSAGGALLIFEKYGGVQVGTETRPQRVAISEYEQKPDWNFTKVKPLCPASIKAVSLHNGEFTFYILAN
jgi:hypothetical protein